MGRPKGTGPNSAKGGILLIENTTTGRALVVESRQIRKRLSDHRQALQQHVHWNHELQSDFDADPRAYRFEVLDEEMSDTMAIREAKRDHIRDLESRGLAYNIKGGGKKTTEAAQPADAEVDASLPSSTPTLEDLLQRLAAWGNGGQRRS